MEAGLFIHRGTKNMGGWSQAEATGARRKWEVTSRTCSEGNYIRQATALNPRRGGYLNSLVFRVLCSSASSLCLHSNTMAQLPFLWMKQPSPVTTPLTGSSVSFPSSSALQVHYRSRPLSKHLPNVLVRIPLYVTRRIAHAQFHSRILVTTNEFVKPCLAPSSYFFPLDGLVVTMNAEEQLPKLLTKTRGHWMPKTRVKDGREPRDAGTGNEAWVLWKSCEYSHHWPISPAWRECALYLRLTWSFSLILI